MRSFQALFSILTMAVLLAGSPARAAVPADLGDFVGALAGQAEGGLAAHGYALVRTHGLTAYWRNASTGVCAKIVTRNGRFKSVTAVRATECGAPAPAGASQLRLGGVACRAAVARIANRNVRDAHVIRLQSTPEGGVLATIGLKGASRPWSCKTDRRRKVISTMVMGEG